MYNKTTVIRVCEVTDLKSEVKFDLWGQAAMASEVMKIAFRGNMPIDVRVIEITELNFEVKSDLWGCPLLFIFPQIRKGRVASSLPLSVPCAIVIWRFTAFDPIYLHAPPWFRHKNHPKFQTILKY